MSVGKAAGGLGLGGLIIVGLITLLMGGDPTEVIEQMGGLGGTEIVSQSGRTPTAEEEELAVFTKQILAGTEDVWTEIFAQSGRTYVPPKLVLYNDYVQTSSGTASAETALDLIRPHRWDVDDCYLYTAFVSVSADGSQDGEAVRQEVNMVEGAAGSVGDVVRSMHDLYGKIRVTIAIEPIS